ncbi:MAG: DNA primase [Lachnospiraceae bacterium]|nr:DNA primase [Lachnospiraceae bacterium]
MSGFFPQEWLDELRNQIDLVAIASEYIPLTQKGRRYWACCPFHQEKTASFSIDSEKQMYYCFGCKASGNVFSFIMNMEHLDFASSVKFLAEKNGVPLPQSEEDERKYRREQEERKRLQGIMTLAARYFRDQLFTQAGQEARKYLTKRGVSESMIRRFGLGFAPNTWDSLRRVLEQNHIPLRDAHQLGLLSFSKGRYFDSFRNRLMFPILDEFGNVIAFGGRVLDTSLPKYINSPDTPIFNKRRQLFGINLVKKEKQIEFLTITEGYMDVISMWQAGFPGAMATMGTAMTENQAKVIRRFSPRVILLYDGDSAGQSATLRGTDILLRAGLEVRIAALPDGLDPDELIKQRGASAMRECLEKSMPLTQFELALEKRKYDLSNSEQRTQYAMAAAGIISKLDSPIERESYLKVLRVETGFSLEALQSQTENRLGKNEVQRTTKNTRQQPEDNKEITPEIRVQRQILRALVMTDPGTWPKETEILSEDDFSETECKTVFKWLMTAAATKTRLEEADILTRLNVEGFNGAGILELFSAEEQNPEPEMLREWIIRQKNAKTEKRIEALKQKLNSGKLSSEEQILVIKQIQDEMKNRVSNGR